MYSDSLYEYYTSKKSCPIKIVDYVPVDSALRGSGEPDVPIFAPAGAPAVPHQPVVVRSPTFTVLFICTRKETGFGELFFASQKSMVLLRSKCQARHVWFRLTRREIVLREFRWTTNPGLTKR